MENECLLMKPKNLQLRRFFGGSYLTISVQFFKANLFRYGIIANISDSAYLLNFIIRTFKHVKVVKDYTLN